MKTNETAQKIQDLYFMNGAKVSQATWEETVALIDKECDERVREKREMAVLKGERRRIIAQIREEVRREERDLIIQHLSSIIYDNETRNKVLSYLQSK